jgi:hypothetical protein
MRWSGLTWLPLHSARTLDPDEDWVPASWATGGTVLAAAPLGQAGRALLVGRAGGPSFLDAELHRLEQLGALAGALARAG